MNDNKKRINNEQEARRITKSMLADIYDSRLININEISEITDVIE